MEHIFKYLFKIFTNSHLKIIKIEKVLFDECKINLLRVSKLKYEH